MPGAQVLCNLECLAHPAERSRLNDGYIRRMQFRHPVGVFDLTDGFIGSNAHKEPIAHQLLAYLRELFRGAAGLFHVIQRHHFFRCGNRLLDAPATIGIDADIGHQVRRVHRRVFAHSLYARDVFFKTLPGFCDFDFPRAHAGITRHDLWNFFCRYCRDGAVDFNGVTHRFRKAFIGCLESCGEPVCGFFRAIFYEGGKFAPAGGAIDKQCFAGGDSAELYSHWKCDNVRAV